MDENFGLSPMFWIVWLAVVVFMIAAWWKVFTRAGKPDWGNAVYRPQR